MNSEAFEDQRKRKHWFLALTTVFVCLLAPSLYAVQDTINPPHTATHDSAFAQRAVESSDSLATPLLTMGSLVALLPNDSLGLSAFSITKFNRRNIRYQTMGELLARGTPYMPLSQGGYGQQDAISVLGGANIDLSVSSNGRPLFEPWSQQFNLAQAPPEATERVEILTGVHAIGLGSTLSLSSVNMQDMQHNTATPFSQLWYAQGGGGFIAADVAFSQNVAPGLNASIGVRRSGAAGRYANTDFDIWNLRLALRYTMDTLNHFGLSYSLASQNTELWGGLRTISPLNQFTEQTAPTVFSTLKDDSRRHDVTLSATHFFNAERRHSVSAQTYVSTNDMLRIRDSSAYTSQSDTTNLLTFTSRHYGALVRSEHHIGNITIHFGAGVDAVQLGSTVYNSAVNDFRPQLFAHFTLPISSVTLFASGRTTIVNGRVLSGSGVGLSWRYSGTSMILDASTIQRPPSPAEGLSLQPERQSVYSFSVKHQSPLFDAGCVVFHRIADAPLTTSVDRDLQQRITRFTTTNGSAQSLSGAYAYATIRTGTIIQEQGIGSGQGWWLEFQPLIRSHYQSEATDSTRRFPLFFGELSVSFVYQTGLNSIRLGVSGSVISPMASIQYLPLTWTFTSPADVQGWAANGTNVFLQATLGNASVRVAYENIFAQRWYTTAVAPYIIRDIRFSVTWSFFD